VERSDGRLATVSYLFGVPEEIEDADEVARTQAAQTEAARTEAALSEAAAFAADAKRAVLQAAAVAAALALDVARAEAAAAVRAAEQLPSERPRTTTPRTTAPRLRAVDRDPGPGWYVDPRDSAENEAVLTNDEGDETPEREPEPEAPAGAVAAARAFLSTVEPRASGAKYTTESTTESESSHKTESAPGSSVRFVAEDDEESDSDDATGRKKPPAVRQASINALARKGMSSAEMADLLEAREVEPDEVVLEVARLEAAGLLDDRVLAEHLVRTLQERKGLGRSAINAELRRRKVDQSAIDEALDTVDVDDELERCLEVAVKRASQLRSYDRPTAERRLSAFLSRRGYAGSVISAAVAQALGPVGPRFR